MSDPHSYKDIKPTWHLVDPLSVEDAAALIAGFDPHAVDPSREYFRNRETNLTDSQGIAWVHTAQTALENAVMAGQLRAKIRRSAWMRGWDEEPEEGEAYAKNVTLRPDDVAEAWGAADPHAALGARRIIYRVAPDWRLTTVAVADVRAWLATRGTKSGFFFPDASDAPDYLDPKHPRYAPRLAAAVNAWLAVTQASGKSVKDSIKKWLREHAGQYGLNNEDGKPNETGIEEVAKVVNWQPSGGAPKTPGQ
ncbi:hypothetical protein [Paraburkholderia dokdonensis]|uniref:hypothetical protein n=1 Tax=Paraburkholderia dokdonensis TaxID=2211211 RepID=UPI001019F165|nr:hypothetical protein [Paraburkholderia dokdonensis]